MSSIRARTLASVVVGALVAAGLFSIASPANAATFTPSPDPAVDGAAGSLRAAIVAATNAGGDTVDLSPGGTYTLTCAGGGTLSHGSTPLTINGNGATIVQTCADSRVLATQGSLTLDSATITGGNGDITFGAGIDANSQLTDTLTISNSLITGNSSTNATAKGAGVYTSAITTITNTTITDNHLTGTTSSTGAGVYAAGTALTLTNTAITSNTAVSGAGLRIGSGDFTMTDSTVSGNSGAATTGATGGGILAQGGDTLITDSTVSDNSAWGGAGYFRDGSGTGKTVTILGSTFSGNTSGSGGGGGVSGLQPVFATNSTFTGNTGGGISANASSVPFAMVLNYVTVDGNTAVGAGSANLSAVGNLSAFGTVVTNPLGGGANCVVTGATTSQGYNYSDTSACGFTGTGDVEDGASPQLGTLADNGGPTETLLPAGSSPLLDRIPTAACDAGAAITTDQRGEARPEAAGGFCDIGAVELASAVPPEPPSPPEPDPTTAPLAIVLPPRFTG